MYASPLKSYYIGWKSSYTSKNETGKVGNYEITGESHSKMASTEYGKVLVYSYYDGDQTTPKTYYSSQLLPVSSANLYFGAGYLGSEAGFILKRGTTTSPNYFSRYYEGDGL